MATIPIPSQLDRNVHPTLTCLDLSVISANWTLSVFYTSQVQRAVMQGIVECLLHMKGELVDAGDDEEEEEGEYEEEEEEEEGEGGEGGEEEEEDDGDDDGEDEPPAKRRKRDDDDDDKKKKEEEGEEEEEEVHSWFAT